MACVTGCPLKKKMRTACAACATILATAPYRPISSSRPTCRAVPWLFPMTRALPGCAVPAGCGQWVILLPGASVRASAHARKQRRALFAEHDGFGHSVLHGAHLGIGEGTAALRIADLTEAVNPTAALYAGDAEMFVRVTAKAASAEAAEARPCQW